MSRNELADDLSYVRALAEEGRHSPLLGGSFLVFWGVLNAAAYLAQWALLTGQLPGGDNGAGFGVLWGVYGLVAGVGSALLGQRLGAKPGHSAIGVRAEKAVWRGVAIAILAVAVGCLLRMIVERDWNAPNAILGPAFALFGVALTVTAFMARERWLWPFAVIAFAASIAFGVWANVTAIYLAASAASALVLAAPGFVLLRREPPALG